MGAEQWRGGFCPFGAEDKSCGGNNWSRAGTCLFQSVAARIEIKHAFWLVINQPAPKQSVVDVA